MCKFLPNTPGPLLVSSRRLSATRARPTDRWEECPNVVRPAREQGLRPQASVPSAPAQAPIHALSPLSSLHALILGYATAVAAWPNTPAVARHRGGEHPGQCSFVPVTGGRCTIEWVQAGVRIWFLPEESGASMKVRVGLGRIDNRES